MEFPYKSSLKFSASCFLMPDLVAAHGTKYHINIRKLQFRLLLQQQYTSDLVYYSAIILLLDVLL